MKTSASIAFAAPLILPLLLVVSSARAADAPKSGTYRGEGLTLELKRDGDNYTGAAVLGDKKFDVEGHFDSIKGVAGTFTSNGKPFPWSAEASADGVKFKTGDSEYQLARDPSPADDNPLAKRSPDDNPLARRAPAPPAPALTPDGELGGAGILLEGSEEGFRITNVAPDGGGAKAGLRVGDVLTAVDGQSVQGMPLRDLGPRVIGPVGSQVKISVLRDGKEEIFAVTRGKLPQAGPQTPPAGEQPAPQPAAPPPPAAKADAPAPTGSLKFTRLSVHDPGINNIEAVSFLIPKDWKVDGGIQWFPDYAVLANLLLKITDPQSGAQIEFLPVQKFTFLTNPTFPLQRFSNYMGQIVHEPITEIPQFIETMYAPKAAPQLQHAKVVGQEVLQKVADQIAKNYQGQSQVKAERVRYAYEINGQPWEEDVYVTLVYTPWQLGTMWAVESAYSLRAPQGQLDRMTPVMMTTVKTCKLSLDWYAQYCYVQQLFNNRMMQGIRNATELSKIISRNADETRQMFADSYRQRQESQDRINQSFGEYIKGVDTYKNPYEERPVELPAGYKDAWVNRAGEYILSEQQAFDPNVGSTTEWQRMNKSP